MCSRINSQVELAPNSSFFCAMLLNFPFAFTKKPLDCITHWYSHTHKFSYLYFFLNIVMTGSRSSHKKPDIESRPLYAGHRLHSIRNSPVNLSREIETPLVLMSSLWITTRQHRFALTRLSIPHLPNCCSYFDCNAHDHHS